MGLVLCLPNLTFAQVKNIDCNSKPLIPATSWSIESSQPDGIYAFNPAEAGKKVVSFESKTAPIKGSELIKKLNGTGLNACVFDYLMDHKELIPVEWKTKNIVFPGTVFTDGGGNRFARSIYWWDNDWQTGVTYLEESYDDRVAAVK